ncbi:MAG: hypothetical protein EOP05_01470 [Proteobacteria bacterium]|nr:MAG: hypothetical protein EOP05_01470 [Pseudomonadota bacterium]
MAMTQLTKRLNRIFENVLGCKLVYQPSEEIAATQFASLDVTALKANLTEAPQYIEGLDGKTFGFPIHIRGSFSGLAVVENFENARPQKLMMLAELLTMVMENGIRQEDRKERLRLIEERLTLLDEDSNVIPLRPARFGRVLQVVDTEMQSEMGDSPIVTTPLLLETDASFPLSRVGIEVHHSSKRWAFLSVEDLPADIFNSKENLEKLGGLTLFIRDLSTLTTSQQTKLAEYLASEPSEDMPHVIAGINESAETLVQAGRLLPQLVQLFAVSSLQTTNKTAGQIAKELIDATLQHIMQKTMETHAVGEHFIPFNMQYFNSDETNSFH